jgi:hypothetical protein
MALRTSEGSAVTLGRRSFSCRVFLVLVDKGHWPQSAKVRTPFP